MSWKKAISPSLVRKCVYFAMACELRCAINNQESIWRCRVQCIKYTHTQVYYIRIHKHFRKLKKSLNEMWKFFKGLWPQINWKVSGFFWMAFEFKHAEKKITIEFHYGQSHDKSNDDGQAVRCLDHSSS